MAEVTGSIPVGSTPRHRAGGSELTLQVAWLTLDAHDPEALARFWGQALDLEVAYDSATDPDAGPGGEREILLVPRAGDGPRLLLLEVHEPKTVKNRLHLDLRPDDRDAEVARLEALGARRADIGQGSEVTWVVLADPEGNEFCVLRPRRPGEPF